MTLSARIQRLERKAKPTDRFAALSDDDLMVRAMTLDASIRQQLGLPAQEYPPALAYLLREGKSPPEGITEPEIRAFIIVAPGAYSIGAGA